MIGLGKTERQMKIKKKNAGRMGVACFGIMLASTVVLNVSGVLNQ